ncbi:MAG: FkbM family methyltransferase [Candidatus Absconditabacteria bacterium]|nr:FkbM family methyltransferase [Candidatus Absconditabacteria bacterium]
MDKYEKALEYEIFTKKEYSFADEVIKKAKVIFDVGGHIGLFSKYCLSINPGCEIHYFEPIPSLYNQTKQGFKNQNVLLNNFGISAKTGQQTIYYNSQKTMQSSKFNQTFLNPKGEEIIVQMQNLEEHCVQQNISHIDLLKIDVEGMEYEILESLSDEFLQKIQALLLEYHCFTSEMQTDLSNIEKILTKHFSVKKYLNQYNHQLGYLLCLLS